MAADLWTSALSLAGVALGGGLTALAQRATQRSAERVEERRQAVATTESRRAEQIGVLKEFVACAQAAERAAYSRPDPWGDDEGGWMTRTGPVMTALWTASGNVTLLCDEALREPVTTYGHALNAAVWRDIGGIEVNEHLEAAKTAFMDAARGSLAGS
ncbi:MULTISPECIES: hypothetical protein [Streptomyces]|uniref:Protein kilB n=1 Tax=Streptomyces griseus subsp. griseus (strain JCM 4626 / CBS 651.72 / NBRC 13350 / KCC S-0626 / ISP 5235) TaxID=455632 RepID=B1VZL4_STRGG|nr:hypothetical protein [Streptomyces griseus]MBW3708629.1 hypothetical protein [Streptomyces griseus]BAG22139.1 hypothetical protein SGR_5310 [Streptomyces griseus subsp. griseus NBRC 13350]SEE57074.1 hypothetical protein SAMN04490359_4163 [Streptomyces griseus]SQA24889.1 Uncharacterised protein [Streptomyces griseus]